MKWGGTYDLSGEGEDEGCARRDVGKHGERGVADEAAGEAGDCGGIEGEVEVRRDCVMLAAILGSHQSRHYTSNQYSITKRVHRPHIRSPVCMAQPSREREQPTQDLRYLSVVREWSKCQHKDYSESESELDAVDELNVVDRPWSQTVAAK
jgi:hypothetical protein